MSNTVVIQIGNTDDKLSQERWAAFVGQLERAIQRLGDVHFFGCSMPDSPWQNCCAVVEVEDLVWKNYDWASFDEWVKHVITPGLADLRDRYNQDSIAMTLGHTEFV